MICRLKERSLFFFHLLPFFTELDLPGLKRTHVKPLSSPLPSIAAGLVVAGCAATAPVLSPQPHLLLALLEEERNYPESPQMPCTLSLWL